MVIAVCSLALAVDREREEIRAAYGSAGPVPALVIAPLGDRAEFPERLATAADVKAKNRKGAALSGDLSDRATPQLGPIPRFV